MTRKLLALAAGAVVGAAVVYAVRALSDRYQGEGGPPDALLAAIDSATSLARDVREGMAEREEQLRIALGLDEPPPGTRLDPHATRELIDDPARWRAPRA